MDERKPYVAPEMEITVFDTEDVITTSNGDGKLSFWVHSIFIPRKQMAASVPFTAKSPLLYPVGVAWRCGRVLIKRRDRLKQTIKAVNKYGK